VGLTNHRLTAERAFVALSLFNIIKMPLSMLPYLVSMIVESSVSMKRLSTFLQYDEIDPENVETREQAAVGMVTMLMACNDITIQVMRML